VLLAFSVEGKDQSLWHFPIFSTPVQTDSRQTMSVREQFEVDLKDKTPNMTG